MRTPSARRLILKNRRKGESRLAQANRLDLPESSIRWCEKHDRFPANPTLAAHFKAAFKAAPVAASGSAQ